MFKQMKNYFLQKRLMRQMKFDLLSKFYLCLEQKEAYLVFLNHLVTDIDYKNFQDDLISKLAEFVHNEAAKEVDKDTIAKLEEN